MRQGHIVICGAGRSGTTLLVRILHRAGLSTGFTDEDLMRVDDHPSQAGLEIMPTRRNRNRLPDVIKSPSFYKAFLGEHSSEWLKVEIMIVPVRDIEAVVRSRKHVTSKTFWEYFTRGWLRGGVAGGKRMIFRQREAALDMFFQNVFFAVKRDIPVILLEFPRFVEDESYFLEKLHPFLLEARGVGKEELREAFRAECDPSKVRIR